MRHDKMYRYIRKHAHVINNLLLSFSSVCMFMALHPLLAMVLDAQPFSWHLLWKKITFMKLLPFPAKKTGR